MRKIMIAGFLIFASLSTGTKTSAQIRINVNIGPPVAPSEVIVESPHVGWLWVPGYHVYRPTGWVWTPGRWEAPPSANQVWIAPRYVHRKGYYDYYEGRWGVKGSHHDNGKHKGWYKHRH
ncbi:MAG: hypothetical protein ABI778_09660 [Ignavibacteriota bacterium]